MLFPYSKQLHSSLIELFKYRYRLFTPKEAVKIEPLKFGAEGYEGVIVEIYKVSTNVYFEQKDGRVFVFEHEPLPIETVRYLGYYQTSDWDKVSTQILSTFRFLDYSKP